MHFDDHHILLCSAPFTPHVVHNRVGSRPVEEHVDNKNKENPIFDLGPHRPVRQCESEFAFPRRAFPMSLELLFVFSVFEPLRARLGSQRTNGSAVRARVVLPEAPH